MSRTEEDIESGVDITIMRDATLSTYPASYSELCDTFLIENRLRQAGFGESGGVHIADRDVIELSNDAGRELVVKITPRVDDACVDVGRLAPFAGALRGSEFVRQLPLDKTAKSLRPKSMPIPLRIGRASA